MEKHYAEGFQGEVEFLSSFVKDECDEKRILMAQRIWLDVKNLVLEIIANGESKGTNTQFQNVGVDKKESFVR